MKDQTRIVKFLNRHTKHQAQSAKIRKSPKSGYSVRVLDHEGIEKKVHFWPSEVDNCLYYGIAGFGIFTYDTYENLDK